MAAVRKDALYGRWVHAHEEDTDDEMIFRPASHPLPPSRGRTSFDLRSDGTYVESAPGPVDAPVESTGRWSLDGQQLKLAAEGNRVNAWEVAATDVDRLVVRRSTPGSR